jgi:hypothetical protein
VGCVDADRGGGGWGRGRGGEREENGKVGDRDGVANGLVGFGFAGCCWAGWRSGGFMMVVSCCCSIECPFPFPIANPLPPLVGAKVVSESKSRSSSETSISPTTLFPCTLSSPPVSSPPSPSPSRSSPPYPSNPPPAPSSISAPTSPTFVLVFVFPASLFTK